LRYRRGAPISQFGNWLPLRRLALRSGALEAWRDADLAVSGKRLTTFSK